MDLFEHNCMQCGDIWTSKIKYPKRCRTCERVLIFKTKYVKSGAPQTIAVSDKCYSMLLRRKKSNDDKISSVIQRLVNENSVSDTVRYKQEPGTHIISVKAELLMQIYEIANKYNIRTSNEVIWRLL